MLARGGKPKMVRRPWAQRECAIIRRHYPETGGRALMRLLSRRTYSAIKKQAELLGVTWAGRQRWTPADEKRLRDYFEADHTLEWIAARMSRPPRRIYRKAWKLGLLGVPQGYETLTDAATRVGYSNASTLRNILRWASVRMHRARAIDHPHNKGCYRVHYVDPFDVDDAVKRYLKCETIAFAARSRQLPVQTLDKWLRKERIVVPHGGRSHRLDPSVVDGVIAKYRAIQQRRAAVRSDRRQRSAA